MAASKRTVRVCAWAAVLSGSLALASFAHARTVVLNDIEYTTDGQPDDSAAAAVQAYFEFLVSRMLSGPPQRFRDYIAECKAATKSRDEPGPCPAPDVLIQLQIAERNGEIQVSGAVSQSGPFSPRTSALDSLRVKARDFSDALGHAVQQIEHLVQTVPIPQERRRVLATCFEIVSRPPEEMITEPTADLSSQSPAQPDLGYLISHIPAMLSAAATARPGLAFVETTQPPSNCAAIESLRSAAEAANAKAVLIGRFYNDDRGGLILRAQLYLKSADRIISLPILTLSQKSDSYFAAAHKLVSLTGVLVTPELQDRMLKVVDENTPNDPVIYLDYAKQLLTLAPPDYQSAETLLDMVIDRAPSNKEAYLLKSSSLSAHKDYAAAETVLEDGLHHTQQKNEFLAALAATASQAGDFSNARKNYEKLLTTASGQALLGIAKTYLAEGKIDRAMEFALKATADRLSAPDAYIIAGQLAETKNDLGSAERYYRAARDISGDSEAASRLTKLYGRWFAEATLKHDYKLALTVLSKSIEISTSVKTLYDRATTYLNEYGRTAGKSLEGYQLASADFESALELARRDYGALSQWPWLLPDYIEVLILQGRFEQAEKTTDELFVLLGSDASVRPYTDTRNIRIIGSFLNAVAEILRAGTAEKQLYLLHNARLGAETADTGWSFDNMRYFLDNDYAAVAADLLPEERAQRATRVRDLIASLQSSNGRPR